MTHQYVERETGAPIDEKFFGDELVRYLYTDVRERAPAVFRAATGARVSRVLGWASFDAPLIAGLVGNRAFLERSGVDLDECVSPATAFRTPRDIFERQIRYWSCRPMPSKPTCVVAPADARALVGDLTPVAALSIKGKLFDVDELLGPNAGARAARFRSGLAAVFRLTPDRYHYTHVPVAGRVDAVYELGGAYHCCHPVSTIELATPASKNRRLVTVFDTDVPGGTQCGVVAMVEVVAMMIGLIVPRYSTTRYEDPRALAAGDRVERGAVKSLFRPGSSTVVLLFEPGRVEPSSDLARNAARLDVRSMLRRRDGSPVVETNVLVRSEIAWAI